MQNDIDTRIADADPVVPLNPAGRDALDRLSRSITGAAVEAPRTLEPSRRPRRALVTIGAALALAAAGSAAAASGVPARTGLFGSGGEQGTGEYIRSDAPDFASVVTELGHGIPLPPAGNFDHYLGAVSALGKPVTQTEGGIKGALAYDAACQWSTYWLDRYTVGDDAEMKSAAGVLREVPSWPELVAGDGDGGTVAMWTRISSAADSSDPDALRSAGYSVNCAAE